MGEQLGRQATLTLEEPRRLGRPRWGVPCTQRKRTPPRAKRSKIAAAEAAGNRNNTENERERERVQFSSARERESERARERLQREQQDIALGGYRKV